MMRLKENKISERRRTDHNSIVWAAASAAYEILKYIYFEAKIRLDISWNIKSYFRWQIAEHMTVVCNRFARLFKG